MKLIHFQGLHCYHDCVITLAGAFGLDYIRSFSGLWSETELRYDPICRVFLTQKMPMALEKMGLILDQPCVSCEERKTGWEAVPCGSFTLVGMDGYLIPWNPLYQLQHGPHYFIAQKQGTALQSCFDPTYGLSGESLPEQELTANAYAIIPVRKSAAGTPDKIENVPDPLLDQARKVREAHPDALKKIIEQADAWIHGAEETDLFPARFVDALLTGRYLYRHFLRERYPSPERACLFQDKHYYDAWKAVKHGFYKAALTKQNPAVFHEACGRLTDLFEQEIALAAQITISVS